jgi:hypothetical protein
VIGARAIFFRKEVPNPVSVSVLAICRNRTWRDGRSPITNLGGPDAINCYRSVTGRARLDPKTPPSSSAFLSAL